MTENFEDRSAYDRTRVIAAAAIVALTLLSAFLPSIIDRPDLFSFGLLINQDIWLAPFFAAACLIPFRPGAPAWTVDRVKESRAAGIALVLLLLLCWAGHYLLFVAHDISRDEQLVVFDAWVFRHGALMWPIDPEWRHVANALNRKFMLPIGAAEAWISGYLPVNAAMHALVGKLADDNLTAPLLLAAGGFFLWRISLRLFPDSPAARFAALAFYIGSAQIVVTGMTKFAMSGHLALNLCWLWLFLRDTRRSHAAAMLVGFLATGLHQPLFHPLFVLPFFGLLLAQKRWRLLAVYLGAYAAIALFWLSWPLWMAAHGVGPVVPIKTGQPSFFDRLFSVLQLPDLNGAWLMTANLVRFVVWQHPLLVPMAAFGAWSAWRLEPIARALTIGFILPVIVMWLLLPWQGGGWGYRYVHPVMGNAVVLGAWGICIAQKRLGLAVERPLLWTTAVALFLVLPIHFHQANRTAAPLAAADRSLGAIDADVVILDEHIHEDFVHNRPDTGNRPVRLLAAGIKPDHLAGICRGRTVTFIDLPANSPPSRRQDALKAAAAKAGCRAGQMPAPWW